MGRDFYERITAGQVDPQDLVKKSFEFLLEREAKESILPQFNIQVIPHYFPEYQKEISLKI